MDMVQLSLTIEEDLDICLEEQEEFITAETVADIVALSERLYQMMNS